MLWALLKELRSPVIDNLAKLASEASAVSRDATKKETFRFWSVPQCAGLAVLFVALSFVVFSPVLGSFFLSDDFGLIGWASSGSFFEPWAKAHGGFFRPMTMAIFWFDYAVWGRNPLGYHVTNTTLHGLNGLLVAGLAWLLLEPIVAGARARRRIGLAAGLLFLVLPCHSEPVAWISGRTDLIATFFGLVSIVTFLGYVRQQTIWRLAASVLSFGLALLAKESVLSLPGIVAVAVVLQMPRDCRVRQLAAAVGLYALVLAGYFVARYAVLGTLVGGYGTHGHLAVGFPELADRLTRHVLRVAAPPLGFDVGPALQAHWGVVLAAYAALAIALVVAAFSRSRIRTVARGALPLAACFLIALIPAFTLKVSTVDTLGERFLYLPSAFAAMGIAFVLMQSFQRRYAGAVAVAAYGIVCTYFLFGQNLTWREAATLSRQVATEVTAVVESTTEPVILVNVPANLRGAYVYMNGIGQAAALLSNEQVADRLHPISAHSVQSADEPVDVLWERATNRVDVRLTDERSHFVHVFDEQPATLTAIGSLEYSLSLQRPVGDALVLRYSAGSVSPVEVESSPRF